MYPGTRACDTSKPESRSTRAILDSFFFKKRHRIQNGNMGNASNRTTYEKKARIAAPLSLSPTHPKYHHLSTPYPALAPSLTRSLIHISAFPPPPFSKLHYRDP
ncbi:hypothetical protein N7G274_008797 [Stereocaulon virgatum]|uniref:Uncharacterized protein n=1 Tax=Stereocaulon virgatum TaxID=373712 RepID=A0ABR3ZYJ6_9LECA